MRLFGICLLLVWALCACSKSSAPAASAEIPRENCLGRTDGLYCDNDEALRCLQGEVAEAEDCAAAGKVCVPGTGCLLCLPLSYSCDGETLLQCSSDGAGHQPIEQCPEGLSCSPEGCLDLCARAERDRSYIGCDYYPVFTINNELDTKFKPAVVIANPNLVSARVTITRGGQRVADVQVEPAEVQTVLLEYDDALRVPTGSAIVRNGAYHLVASVPVTVHQFNPLLFELDEDCARNEEGDNTPGEADDDKCNSFSNDASLLLPTHALVRAAGETLSYLTNTRASFSASSEPAGPYLFASPGFVSIVGVGERAVHVTIKSSAYTIASRDYVASDAGQGGSDAGVVEAGAAQDAELPADAASHEELDAAADAGLFDPGVDAAGEGDGALRPGPDSVAPLSPGATQVVTLMPGDVLQLLSAAPTSCEETPVSTLGDYICPLGNDYDLTGTAIEADGPIEVIAGHNCSYVPLDRVACDHLEETMFPVDTWGVEAIVPRPRAGAQLPHVLRVLSAADDNTVSFAPAIHEPVKLARGETLELVTTAHVIVSAQKPISVAQYLVGQNGLGTVGDPSMSIAIPVEQYRSSYAFLSPATYVVNFVTIIAQAGDSVVLDGQPVSGFVDIADGAYQVAAVQLGRSGAHEVHSSRGLGIGVLVYGYGEYTSYMLPGGLDLRRINVLF